ncbi:MAG: hypothetical protein OQL09_04745 [Gammaproteobacteria bacterium]|nr:hypothetical protein [Gammaproteobacteria bacterium]
MNHEPSGIHVTEAFEITQRDSAQSVRLTFTGLFEGREVVWNASIKTLHACYLEQQRAAIADRCTVVWRQFIDIRCEGDACQVEIGLNLRQIDEPAIKRAIIMMRKYKRLHLGRHEYGEAIHFETDTG